MAPLRGVLKQKYIYLGPKAQSAGNAKRKQNLWIFCLQLSSGPEGKPETRTLFVSRLLRDLIQIECEAAQLYV
jgi:hypothetical protein